MLLSLLIGEPPLGAPANSPALALCCSLHKVSHLTEISCINVAILFCLVFNQLNYGSHAASLRHALLSEQSRSLRGANRG